MILLASATSRFSGYIKLAYCSSVKLGSPVGSGKSILVVHCIQKVLGSIPSCVPFFFSGFLYSLRKFIISKSLQCVYLVFISLHVFGGLISYPGSLIQVNS